MPEAKDGSTALMIAVREGQTDSLRALLDGSAEKDCQDNDGHSELMLATEVLTDVSYGLYASSNSGAEVLY